jgi:hypothetical protein
MDGAGAARRSDIFAFCRRAGEFAHFSPNDRHEPHSRNAALPLPLFPINLTLIAAAPCLSTGN